MKEFLRKFLLDDADVHLFYFLLHGVGVVMSCSGWLSVFQKEFAWGLSILWHSDEKGLLRDMNGFLRD